MNISVIGTGYVGLVTGTCLAESGNHVICVDIDESKIEKLKAGQLPFYEPGLKELMERNLREARLSFSTDIGEAAVRSFIIFIAVGTPTGEDGSVDLSQVYEVAAQIGKSLQRGEQSEEGAYKIVVVKSTVPVGTCEKIGDFISGQGGEGEESNFEVVSNPEFLKEGTAVDDFMRPDRVIIGTTSSRAAAVLRRLYGPFVRTEKPIIVMDIRSAEMTKYASNAYLAARISIINEIANICERVGADITAVRRGMGADSRIGYHFLFPGVGYGGSCFPKDLDGLIATSRREGYLPEIFLAVQEVNRRQREHLIAKIENHFGRKLGGKVFAIWGLAFKPRTDDMREAPSVEIINHLLKAGAVVNVHDPAALKEARKIFGERINYFSIAYDALGGADALVVVTEWNEFRQPDLRRMRELMHSPVIFDGRNIYDPAMLKNDGFIYYSIGRK